MLTYDFGRMSRFNARTMAEKLDIKLGGVDAWIRETNTRHARLMKQLASILDPENTGDFPKSGNPYFAAAQVAMEALRNAELGFTLRDEMGRAFIAKDAKLVDIIDQTKDTELESETLKLQKELMDQVQENYREQIRENREESRRFQEKMIDRMDDMMNALARSMLRIEERTGRDSGEEAFPRSQRSRASGSREADSSGSGDGDEDDGQPEDGEKPVLTAEEKLFIAKHPKNKSAAFLAQKHPDWTSRTIAEFLDTNIKYVQQYRNMNIDA